LNSVLFRPIRSFFAVLVISLACAAGLPAQTSDAGQVSARRLLYDALLFSVDISVSEPGGNSEFWTDTVDKITIPGRAVAVSLVGADSRLKVNFTIYPGKREELLLVAQSETWVGGAYSSAFTSLSLAYREEVYYYPLGRASDGIEGNPAEVRMIISVVPYLETLDSKARDELLSVFDTSAQFDLSGEDP
jgi:hypothetical protein